MYDIRIDSADVLPGVPGIRGAVAAADGDELAGQAGGGCAVPGGRERDAAGRVHEIAPLPLPGASPRSL